MLVLSYMYIWDKYGKIKIFQKKKEIRYYIYLILDKKIRSSQIIRWLSYYELV